MKSATEVDTADMLDFLEANPVCFGSGYMKEKLLAELKRRKLGRNEKIRLQEIIISVIEKPDYRREFRRYCRAAVNVDDQMFRDRLETLQQSVDTDVARRARWVLAGMDGRYLDLRKAARDGWRHRIKSSLL